jgi:hypothetical protein
MSDIAVELHNIAIGPLGDPNMAARHGSVVDVHAAAHSGDSTRSLGHARVPLSERRLRGT